MAGRMIWFREWGMSPPRLPSRMEFTHLPRCVEFEGREEMARRAGLSSDHLLPLHDRIEIALPEVPEATRGLFLERFSRKGAPDVWASLRLHYAANLHPARAPHAQMEDRLRDEWRAMCRRLIPTLSFLVDALPACASSTARVVLEVGAGHPSGAARLSLSVEGAVDDTDVWLVPALRALDQRPEIDPSNHVIIASAANARWITARGSRDFGILPLLPCQVEGAGAAEVRPAGHAG